MYIMPPRDLGPDDYEHMHLPREHWSANQNRIPVSILDRVVSYHAKFKFTLPTGVGILFTGARGVGKTSAAAWLLKEVRSRALMGLFVMPLHLREAVRNTERGDVALLARAREVQVLVLDDLRAEDFAARYFNAEDFRALLMDRKENRLPTFITVQGEPTLLERPPFGPLWLDLRSKMVHLHVEGSDLSGSAHKALTEQVFSSEEALIAAALSQASSPPAPDQAQRQPPIPSTPATRNIVPKNRWE